MLVGLLVQPWPVSVFLMTADLAPKRTPNEPRKVTWCWPAGNSTAAMMGVRAGDLLIDREVAGHWRWLFWTLSASIL
jgi:hypothetical protein